MMTDEIVDRVEHIRSQNNVLWMKLLRLALEARPKEAKALLAAINGNDRDISTCLGRLAG